MLPEAKSGIRLDERRRKSFATSLKLTPEKAVTAVYESHPLLSECKQAARL